MKKTSILIAFCWGAVCALPAFSQAAGGGSDQEFVNFAGQTDMTEAHLGQMAADQASAQGVKDYAQMLTTDHTNDYQQLTMAATKAGLTVPKGLDAQHDKMIAPFEKLKGAAFDRHFEQEMITGHTKAIAEYQKEANNGQNADIKAYANQTLPTLQKHLEQARDLQKSKGGAKSSKM
jgi:putative membrane protein